MQRLDTRDPSFRADWGKLCARGSDEDEASIREVASHRHVAERRSVRWSGNERAEERRELGGEFALGEDGATAEGAGGLHDLGAFVADEADGRDIGGVGVRGEELERAQGLREAEVEDHEPGAACRRGKPLDVAEPLDGDAERCRGVTDLCDEEEVPDDVEHHRVRT